MKKDQKKEEIKITDLKKQDITPFDNIIDKICDALKERIIVQKGPTAELEGAFGEFATQLKDRLKDDRLTKLDKGQKEKLANTLDDPQKFKTMINNMVLGMKSITTAKAEEVAKTTKEPQKEKHNVRVSGMAARKDQIRAEKPEMRNFMVTFRAVMWSAADFVTAFCHMVTGKTQYMTNYLSNKHVVITDHGNLKNSLAGYVDLEPIMKAVGEAKAAEAGAKPVAEQTTTPPPVPQKPEEEKKRDSNAGVSAKPQETIAKPGTITKDALQTEVKQTTQTARQNPPQVSPEHTTLEKTEQNPRARPRSGSNVSNQVHAEAAVAEEESATTPRRNSDANKTTDHTVSPAPATIPNNQPQATTPSSSILGGFKNGLATVQAFGISASKAIKNSTQAASEAVRGRFATKVIEQKDQDGREHQL